MAASILATFGLSFAAPLTAQDGTLDLERTQRAEASIEYNAATRVQREGYEHEVGGPGTQYLDRCLMDCVHHALLSFQAMPGLLSSWRMASCASGRSRHVTAWLAFAAFDQIEPAGVAAYESNHISTADRVRVLAAYARRNDLVGGVRLGPLPPGYRAAWPGSTPVRVDVGGLADSDNQLFLVDGVYYGLAGTTHSILVTGNGESRRVEFRFTPISSGIQEVNVGPTIVEAADLPLQPGRNEVGVALRQISSRVAACGNGTRGTAQARMVFDSSGHIQSVDIRGVPPAVRSCVEEAMRSARLPPFRRATFSVVYPFRVR